MQGLSGELEKRGHHVTTYLTRYAGDGQENIDAMSRNMDRIVVVGGDGTLNEIINGLDEQSTCPVLHYPTGNANLLAKDLNLPQKTSQVVHLIEQGNIIRADVGIMNGTRFLMVCGMGFDARVTEEVKNRRIGKVSNLSYVFPFIKALRGASDSELFVDIDDGSHQEKGKAVLVCNVRNYGGICEMATDAGVTTGELDVIILPKENLFALLSYLSFALFSRVDKIKDVVYLKAKKSVVVRSEELIPVELDGDFQGRHEEIRIDCRQGIIPLIVPSG